MSDLDTLIRQGLGRLVDSTPIAPSFEQVTQSVPGPTLRSSTRRATHGRDPRLHILLAGAGMTVLVGAGVRYAVANSRNGDAPAHGGASVRLAGYTAHLPSGYLVSAAKIPDCRTFPVSAHPFPLESSSTYTIATPNATACIGSLLSATYGTGTLPVAGGTASTGNEVALWVQIPSTGGGYHDLVVGSWGLSEAELIALVQSALPKHAAAAEAGHPPWSVLPVCAPGQTPDADSPSGRACSDT
jgi:hypothetical protein